MSFFRYAFVCAVVCTLATFAHARSISEAIDPFGICEEVEGLIIGAEMSSVDSPDERKKLTQAIESGTLDNDALADAYTDRSDTYDLSEDEGFAKAVADADRAVKAAPGNARAQRGAALLAIIDEKFDVALPHLDRALTTKPDDMNALSYRAMVHRAKGNYGKALDDYERMLALKKTGSFAAVAYKGMACTYIEQKKYNLALEAAGKELEFTSRRGHREFAYYRRSVIYRLMGQREKAITEIKKALEVDPEFVSAKALLKSLGGR